MACVELPIEGLLKAARLIISQQTLDSSRDPSPNKTASFKPLDKGLCYSSVWVELLSETSIWIRVNSPNDMPGAPV